MYYYYYSATLRAFNIEDFFPQPKQNVFIGDILQAFASALAVLAGLTPGVSGVGLSQGANAVGAVASFIGNNKNPPTSTNVAQKVFAASVGAIYQDVVGALDNMTDLLFDGGSIGDFTILDMMKDGAWLLSSSLQRVSNIEEALRIELVSQSIDHLWKTSTSNKMFVLFVNKSSCDTDVSGPPSFKRCGDGGVYYAYNFIEGGEGVGHLGLPWGADKMKDQLRIDPTVRSRFSPTQSVAPLSCLVEH